MFLLFVGWEKITALVRRHNTVAALLSYIGMYYILDFEYPQLLLKLIYCTQQMISNVFFIGN